jgi:hypothetical protein
MVGIYDAIKKTFTGNTEHQVFQVRNLEEFLEHIQKTDLPQKFRKVEYEIQQPIQIEYLNRDEFLPIANDDFDETSDEDYELAEEIAMEHIKQRGSFFCDVVDKTNPKVHMEMFGNILIDLEFKLDEDNFLHTIPNASIFLESKQGIGYTTVSDLRCYTKNILYK